MPERAQSAQNGSSMNETPLTIVGNLTADPQGGKAGNAPDAPTTARFSVAVNRRKFDRQFNEWKDQPPTFWRCDSIGPIAETILGELRKGRRVIAHGHIQTREWVQDGETKSITYLAVTDIGVALLPPNMQAQSHRPQPPTAAAADEPWGASPTPGSYNDETPF